MIYTFKDLQDQVLNWLDEADNTTTTRTNVKEALNQAHQERLMQYRWPHMIWDRAETITMVAAQRLYSLHQEYNRPLYFRNQGTGEMLIETPRRNIDAENTDWDNDTDTNRFVLAGWQTVKAQPTSASVITVVSDSASDNSSTYNITVRGVDSNGAVVTNTITPNGTTPVAGTQSFVKILSIVKTAATNGTLTFTSNSAAVTVLSLTASEYARQYRQLELLYQPTAGDVIEYKFYRQPLKMTVDYDIPEIPAPYSQVLVWDALLMLMSYDGQLDEGRMATISNQRGIWENAMLDGLGEGLTMNAEPRLIRERVGYHRVQSPS